jgi:hypothetical protein
MEGWRFALSEYPYSEFSDYTDVYEFGVYTGVSLNWINEALDKSNIYGGRDIRKIFGFDSFCGLPPETEDERIESVSNGDEFQWKAGDFDSQEHFNTNGIEETVQSVRDFVEPNLDEKTCLELIPGYFSDSLSDDIVEKYDMKPACYVDLDADLYLSTIDALDFMFRNKLIRVGTLIGYDDWGGTPKWKSCEDGVSKAHVEMMDKYSVKLDILRVFGQAYPHVHAIFIVRSIG